MKKWNKLTIFLIPMANKHVIADGTAKDIFSNDAVIAESKIKRTEMGMIANDLGLGKDILSPQELVDVVKDRLRS